MKKFVIVAAATVLLGAPAFAQGNTRQAPQSPGASNAPVYQQGSGQQSGGPARELNSPTGAGTVAPGTMTPGMTTGGTMAPGMTTGSTRGEAADTSNARQAPALPPNAQVPAVQQGSGQQSGGPARELNSQTGIPGRQ